MIATLFAMTAIQSTKVEDFFPTTVGAKWVYEEISDVRFQYTDEIMPTLDVLGTPTIPIRTSRKGSILGTNYYRIEGDTVFLFSTDKETALPAPLPFLKVGLRESQWSFSGQTPFGQSMLPIEMKATSAHAGMIQVLGQDRESLKLTVSSKISEAGGLITIKSQSTAIYAKGVGMVEMTESVAYTKTKSTRKVKLVSFELPK